MKLIETQGITHLEKFDSCLEWYWGTDYANGDLYEAEETFLMGEPCSPNRLIFVHYPDGTVYEPIKPRKNQYFGTPAYINGFIYILLVSFEEKAIRVFRCSNDRNEVILCIEISLHIVKDCYNLKIDGEPLMLTRQGAENHFQILWPDEIDFCIGNRECFLFRQGDKLYFSEWHEDPDYREEINIRDYATGKLLEKIQGSQMTMPDGQCWILR